MTEVLFIGPDIRNFTNLFELIAERFKIGQSVFDGWDDFYDIFFNYLESSRTVINLEFSTNFSENDWEKLLDYMRDLNEDLDGKAEVTISGSNLPNR